MKIIIDTNFWINYLLNQMQSPINEILDNETFEVISCTELTEEIFDVLNRPRIKKRISDLTIVEVFREYYSIFTLNYQITSKVEICRDKKDNYLLALALDSQADFLLSNDKDLLDLESFGKTKIITLYDFHKWQK